MDTFTGTRRSVLKRMGNVGATFVIPIWPRLGSAQNQICAPGKIERLKIWNDFIIYEGSVNIGNAAGKGGGSGKLPKQVIRWELICDPAPPPPPPPNPAKPAPKNGLYSNELYLIREGWLDEYLFDFRARDLYFNVGIPSFARIQSSGANLRMETLLSDGAVSIFTTSLTLDGGGFRISSPSTVDSFVGATRSTAVAGTWSVSDIVLNADAAGAEDFGIGAHYAGRPLYGSSGLAFSHSSRPVPPIYTDPLGLETGN